MIDFQAHTKAHVGRAKIKPAECVFFLPGQARWIRDQSRLKLMEKGRQLGITLATAYGAVNEGGKRGQLLDYWVSSRDENDAKRFVMQSRDIARFLGYCGEEMGEKMLASTDDGTLRLSLANGNGLWSLSSNFNAQAGKPGHRILDEFALHQQNRELYGIALGGIKWAGARLAILSTHRGPANYFNELVEEAKHCGNPKRISLHRYTLQDALDEGLLYKLQQGAPLEDEIQGMDEAEYFNHVMASYPDREFAMQEEMCVPLDEASAFLPYALIASCEYEPGTQWETDLQDAKGDLYVGGDIGRVTDLTVFPVLESVGDVLHLRRLEIMRRETFDAQERVLYGLLALPQARRASLDNSGIGRQLCERARDTFGWKVEPVDFTGAMKEVLAYGLRKRFEERTIRIPRDAALAADLHSVRRETTPSNNVRLAADRTDLGHADRFWALALAVHAADTSEVPGRIIPATGRLTETLRARRSRMLIG